MEIKGDPVSVKHPSPVETSFQKMLLLHILSGVAFAAAEVQTTATRFLVKRSPDPTGTVSTETQSVDSSLPAEQLKTHDKLKAVRAALARPMHDLSVFDSFVPTTKRQRINPTSTESTQLSVSESLISTLEMQNSGGLKATRTDNNDNLANPTLASINPQLNSIEPMRLGKTNMKVFNMDLNLTTVNEAWQEYKYGINGNPSLEKFLNRYRRVKVSNSDGKVYSLRKKMYNFIEMTMVENGKSEIEAVNNLEEFRINQGWSLRYLQTNIPLLKIDPASGKPILPPPIFKLSRRLQTVKDVWQEYKYGIDGNPSVESIVNKYGPKWFQSAAEERFYTARKRIYDYIKKYIANGESESGAVQKLEGIRISKNWTLNQLLLNFSLVRMGVKSATSTNDKYAHVSVSRATLDARQNESWKANLATPTPTAALSLSEPISISEPTLTVYNMLRNLTTVPEVWQEYKYGINGNPSIESLLTKYGRAWLGAFDLRLYRYRQRIYDFVEKWIERGKIEDEAIKELEEFRIEQGWTLHTLQLKMHSILVDEASRNIIPLMPVNCELLRNLTTVPEVWNEYKYGINGNPSVESLVQNFTAKFFNSAGLRYHYYGRKNIYDYIAKAMANGALEEDAINSLEQLRLDNNWNLGQLQSNIPSLEIDEATGKLKVSEPIYNLLRNLKTVNTVWQEYKYGINGNPSVESIVSEHGTKWLKSKANQVLYYRRKKIYDFIQSAIANGSTEAAVVKELENFRISKKWTLSQLQLNFSQVEMGASSMNETAAGVPQADYNDGVNEDDAEENNDAEYNPQYAEV